MKAIIWILALVAANLIVSHFGPVASVPTAFLFIGLDLTLRDRIHDSWKHSQWMWLRMLVLIACAGAISWFISRSAGRIAVASAVALVASQIVDALVYQAGCKWPKFKQVNASNMASATVDSFLFPTIAFGGFIWWATLGQIVAKVVGGLLWYPVVMRKVIPVAVGIILLCSATAHAQQVELHRDIDRELNAMTLSTFKPYNHFRLFAWSDVDYDETLETIYGEASITTTHGFTAEYNGGVAKDIWEISDVGLFGYEWKNLRLLYRTDGEPQVTYYWRHFWDKIEFSGFVDVWLDNSHTIVLSEPQLWYRLNNRLCIGSEVEVSDNFVYGEDGVQFKPTIAIRIDL